MTNLSLLLFLFCYFSSGFGFLEFGFWGCTELGNFGERRFASSGLTGLAMLGGFMGSDKARL